MGMVDAPPSGGQGSHRLASHVAWDQIGNILEEGRDPFKGPNHSRQDHVWIVGPNGNQNGLHLLRAKRTGQKAQGQPAESNQQG